MSEKHDPATSSWYLDGTFHDWLVETFRDWRTDAREIIDQGTRDSCRRLLEREARLLDEWRLGDWLAMFAPECVCWAPSTEPAGDPRREIAVLFDDRRRMEDRVYRLETDYAWSQQPRARTVRMVTNVEVFAVPDEGDALMTRSVFLTTELRDGELRRISGWNGHYLRRKGNGWEIVVRQTNLIECDLPLRNPSLIL